MAKRTARPAVTGGAPEVSGALAEKRMHDPRDDADKLSHRPNFAMLIYPAYLRACQRRPGDAAVERDAVREASRERQSAIGGYCTRANFAPRRAGVP